MPRKLKPKLCGCGCGVYTCGGEYLPGHDTRVYSAIIDHVGGISNLRKLVEKSTREPVIVK